MSRQRNQGDFWDAVHLGNVKDVIKIAKLGVDLDNTSRGASAVYVASQQGDVTMIDTLSKLGADVNLPAGDGTTPIGAAVHGDRVDAVKALVKQGGDVNIPNNAGATPMYMAAQNGYVKSITTLGKLGADVHIASAEGVTPIYIATLQNQVDAITLLAKLGGVLCVMDVLLCMRRLVVVVAM